MSKVTPIQAARQLGRRAGRAKTSGRFSSREDLVEFVCSKYYNTPLSLAEIARMAEVSSTTADNIISHSGEGHAWVVRQDNSN